LFVEADARVARTLRENVDSVGLAGATALVNTAQKVALAEPAGVSGAQSPYNIVFADPPYRLSAGELRAVLADLHSAGWLAEQAVLVIERSARDDPWLWPTSLRPIRDRRYGEAWLWYGRAP
jgi:16S rRNA (guanine966-N2)-methyltransferase